LHLYAIDSRSIADNVPDLFRLFHESMVGFHATSIWRMMRESEGRKVHD